MDKNVKRKESLKYIETIGFFHEDEYKEFKIRLYPNNYHFFNGEKWFTFNYTTPLKKILRIHKLNQIINY